MTDERIEKIIQDIGNYDEAKEDSLRSMLADFYNKRMLSSIIVLWVYGIAFTALCIFSAVRFFDTENVKDLIMYATIFLSSVVFISLVKTFAWQMIHRNSIKREIKRLEVRIAELAARS